MNLKEQATVLAQAKAQGVSVDALREKCNSAKSLQIIYPAEAKQTQQQLRGEDLAQTLNSSLTSFRNLFHHFSQRACDGRTCTVAKMPCGPSVHCAITATTCSSSAKSL